MLRSLGKAGAASLPRRAARTASVVGCNNGILPASSDGSVQGAAAQGTGPTRTFSQSVRDACVNITFVDVTGERLTVPGFVGQNLVDVAKKHEILLEGPCNNRGAPKKIRRSERFTEYLYGEGPMCTACHVMIPNEFVPKLDKPFEYEGEFLQKLGDLYSPGSSRMGCQIVLTKELDGMTVFIPDGPPLDGS